MDAGTERNDEIKEFEALFKRNHSSLCHKVYTLVKDADLAADIVQNVFLKYWMNRKQTVIHTSIEAYLFRACVNEAYNTLKSGKRKAEFMEYLSSSGAASANSTEDSIALSETRSKINAAIRNMPPACQEVFLLSRYDEMSHLEIASYLNISVNTVNNHMKRALHIMKEYISITTLIMALLRF